jgi:hypothetical protein
MMSDLIPAEPTELTAAELDLVAAGAQFPNISINVQLNNDISVQNAIGLAVLSPGAIVTPKNFNFSFQGNTIF